MALTPSTMLDLGTQAPDFRLLDTRGGEWTLDDIRGADALVVIFMCNHCPYVKHIRQQLAAVAREYKERNVAFIGINSNDVDNYPDDGPEKMAREVETAGYVFPYLFDETQAVAKAYRAACTPDIFVFDRDFKLVYRGQFDDSRPGNNVPVTGRDLTDALDRILAGETVPEQDQKPSMGCNIKWKPGNVPDYFG